MEKDKTESGIPKEYEIRDDAGALVMCIDCECSDGATLDKEGDICCPPYEGVYADSRCFVPKEPPTCGHCEHEHSDDNPVVTYPDGDTSCESCIAADVVARARDAEIAIEATGGHRWVYDHEGGHEGRSAAWWASEWVKEQTARKDAEAELFERKLEIASGRTENARLRRLRDEAAEQSNKNLECADRMQNERDDAYAALRDARHCRYSCNSHEDEFGTAIDHAPDCPHVEAYHKANAQSGKKSPAAVPGKPKLTRNAIRCRHCDDVIESTHVHDLRWCRCGTVAVDGGLEYLKRTGYPGDFEDLSEYDR